MQQPVQLAPPPQDFNPAQHPQMYQNASYYIVQNPYQQPQQVYIPDQGANKAFQQNGNPQQKFMNNGQANPNKVCPPCNDPKGDHKPFLDLKKTKICPLIQQGQHCIKGDRCNFAHSQAELRAKPNLAKTKMCPNFVKKGQCEFGDNCNFAHSELELRSTASHYKTSLCNNFMAGECKLGDLCRFAHGQADLRQKEQPEKKPFNQYQNNNYRGGYQNQRGGFHNQQNNHRGGYQNQRGGNQNQRGGYQNGRGGYQNQRGGFQNDNNAQAYQANANQVPQQQLYGQPVYMDPGKEPVMYQYLPQVRPQGVQGQYIMAMPGQEIPAQQIPAQQGQQKLPAQYQKAQGENMNVVPQFQGMMQPQMADKQGQIPGGYQVQSPQQGQIIAQPVNGAQMVQNIPMGIPNMK